MFGLRKPATKKVLRVRTYNAPFASSLLSVFYVENTGRFPQRPLPIELSVAQVWHRP